MPGEKFSVKRMTVRTLSTSGRLETTGKADIHWRSAKTAEIHENEPWPTMGLGPVFKGIWRMGTCFFIWDISYLVAVVFTGACVFLVTNAVISFPPIREPEFPASKQDLLR